MICFLIQLPINSTIFLIHPIPSQGTEYAETSLLFHFKIAINILAFQPMFYSNKSFKCFLSFLSVLKATARKLISSFLNQRSSTHIS